MNEQRIDWDKRIGLPDGIDQSVQRMIEAANDCEAQCVTNVLKQLLGREPLADDFKKCTKAFHSENLAVDRTKYELLFENKSLGWIHLDYMKPPDWFADDFPNTTFTVRFVANAAT